jgi:hypothetical protein
MPLRSIHLLKIAFVSDVFDAFLGWNDIVVARDYSHCRKLKTFRFVHDHDGRFAILLEQLEFAQHSPHQPDLCRKFLENTPSVIEMKDMSIDKRDVLYFSEELLSKLPRAHGLQPELYSFLVAFRSFVQTLPAKFSIQVLHKWCLDVISSQLSRGLGGISSNGRLDNVEDDNDVVVTRVDMDTMGFLTGADYLDSAIVERFGDNWRNPDS